VLVGMMSTANDVLAPLPRAPIAQVSTCAARVQAVDALMYVAFAGSVIEAVVAVVAEGPAFEAWKMNV